MKAADERRSMFSQARSKLSAVCKSFSHKIAEDRKDDIDPSAVIRPIIMVCCIFVLAFLSINALMDAPTITHGLLSLLSLAVLFMLRTSRSPRTLGLFYLSASTIVSMLSFGLFWTKITYFFQWFVPIYVFALLVTGNVYFLIFSAVYVGASMIFLNTQGEQLIQHEIAKYSDRSFWLLISNDTAAQLLSIAILVLFETFRMKAERAANIKRVESAKISHRSAYADMVGHLAHEFNNPLAVIHAASIKMRRLPQSAVPDLSASRLQLSNYIGDSITRMDDLLQKLLIFARGSDRETKQSLTMRLFLHSMADRFGPLCEDRAIELRTSDSTDRRAFSIRTQSLAFALEKLVQNSVEALSSRRQGGYISIAASNSEDHLRILVRDNGEGIAPGEENRIFDPFYTRKATVLNRGLGLSMAKGLLEMDGGEIYLDRNSQDTCFVLTLPILK